MEQEFQIKGNWLIVSMPEELDHHAAGHDRGRFHRAFRLAVLLSAKLFLQ